MTDPNPESTEANSQAAPTQEARPATTFLADMIAEVLMDIKHLDAAHKVRSRVRELTAKFPLPY